MIDPSLTAVRRRRVVAAAVDLALPVGVFATLAALQLERFSRHAGSLTAADRERMAVLRTTVNRYVELGDTRYVLTGGALVTTLVVAGLTALAVQVLIPALTGTSPGKRLLGLRVVTTGGDPIDLHRALLRCAVGVVDVLPGVVPGALGAAVARRSPLHQRLGDRVAGTVVVDARRPLVMADEPAPPDEGRVPVGGPAPSARTAGPMSEPAVDLHERGTGEGYVERRTVAPDDLAVVDEPWVRPRAERAPVWDPTALGLWREPAAALPTVAPGGWGTETTSGPRRRADDPAPATAPGSAEPEPTPTSAAAIGVGAGSAAPPGTGTGPSAEPAEPVGATTPSGDEPVWNHDWQAWLYFDRASNRWHRHDTASGTWEPIG